MRRHNTKKGFSLLEVLIALTIVSLAFIVVSSSYCSAYMASKKARNHTIAAALAEQVIENYIAEQIPLNNSSDYSKNVPIIQAINPVAKYNIALPEGFSITVNTAGSCPPGGVPVLELYVTVMWKEKDMPQKITMGTVL